MIRAERPAKSMPPNKALMLTALAARQHSQGVGQTHPDGALHMFYVPEPGPRVEPRLFVSRSASHMSYGSEPRVELRTLRLDECALYMPYVLCSEP